MGRDDKVSIWHVIIVVTLISWVTIFLFFYVLPLIMAGTILKSAESFLLKEEQKIPSISQKNIVPQFKNIIQISEQPFPKNGTYKIFYDQGKGVATFKVIAEPYHNYLVKLEDHFDNPVLDIYIRAGDTAKIRVPLGIYELKWIRGEKWYGEDNMFGSTSTFNKVGEPMKFKDEDTNNGKKIIGNTINFNFINGNTPSIKSSVNEF
jgi:hypothetical protein